MLSSTPMSPNAFYEAFLSILQVHGFVAVPSGVGGGVLFVPIVGGFFPFHLDFVRGQLAEARQHRALRRKPHEIADFSVEGRQAHER